MSRPRLLLLLAAGIALAILALAWRDHEPSGAGTGQDADPAVATGSAGRLGARGAPGLVPTATRGAAKDASEPGEAEEPGAPVVAGPDEAWRTEFLEQSARNLTRFLAALEGARKAGDTKAWLRAASDLGMLGLQMQSAHPPFLDRLREEAAPALLWGLGQDDEKLVEGASRWLSTMGTRAALQPLLDAYRGAGPALRAGIVLAVGGLGEAARIALPQIEAAAQDPDPRLRRRAFEALASLGVAVDHVPLARAALDDDDAQVRENALMLLEAAGEEAGHLKREILGLLDDPDADVRFAAGSALARLHPAIAVEVGLERLGLGDAGRRAQAAWMLGGLAERAVSAVPGLIRALEDDAPEVRKAAAWALGRMGDKAREAGEALVALVEEEAPLGYEAVLSLGRIDPDAYFDVFARVAREHPQGRMRFAALHAMNPSNTQARALIVRALRDRDAMVRTEMLKRVTVWGQDGARAIARVLDESAGAFRHRLILALMRMGRAAEPALPALRRLAEDARSGGAAKTAIRQIERALGR